MARRHSPPHITRTTIKTRPTSTEPSRIRTYVGAPGRIIGNLVTHLQESSTEELLWEALALSQQALLLTLALAYTLISWAWFPLMHGRAPNSGEGIFHNSDQFDINHRAARSRTRTTKIRQSVMKRMARQRSQSHSSLVSRKSTGSSSSLNSMARKSLRRLESKRTKGLVEFYETLKKNTKQRPTNGGESGQRIVLNKKSIGISLWPSAPPPRAASEGALVVKPFAARVTQKSAPARIDYSATDAIWDEVLTTESRFLSDIDTTITAFMKPMEDTLTSGKPVATADEIATLFGNLRALIPINTELLKALEEGTKVHKSQRTEVMAKAIIRVMPFFKTYTAYTANFGEAMEVLQVLSTRKNKRFKTFLNACQEDEIARRLPLDAYLIKPIQRLMKYPLFLRELLKSTDKNDGGYKLLLEAQISVEAVAAHVDERTKGRREAIETMSLINEISVMSPTKSGKKDSVNKPFTIELHTKLLEPHRRLLMQSDCIMCGRNLSLGTVESKTAQGRLLLFSDLLVLVHVVGPSALMQLTAVYELDEVVASQESIQGRFPVLTVEGRHSTGWRNEHDTSYMVWFGAIDLNSVLKSILEAQEKLGARASARLSAVAQALSDSGVSAGSGGSVRPGLGGGGSTSFSTSFWPLPDLTSRSSM